jgi:predicted O-methyltransferase YrrM
MRIKYSTYWRKTSFKQKNIGDFFLDEVRKKKPKNFLEIGIFHGVTSRNVCELLYSIHKNDFKFTGIDLFSDDSGTLRDEVIPNTKFSNPLKTIYYKYIVRLDPYSIKSVKKLLKKFIKNINIIQGNSNEVLKKLDLNKFDYVFVDGGHKFETVKNDLDNLAQIIDNGGTILCDDYDLSYAPGVKNAINQYVKEKNFNLKILYSRFAEITKSN